MLDDSTGVILDAKSGHTAKHGHYLATACNLAYCDREDGTKQFRDELNLEARLISVDNTQAWIGENTGAIVVAFRGSESPTSLDGFKDWLLTNARNFLVLPEGQLGTDFAAAGVGARFHRGFMEALAEIWSPLYATVDEAMQRHERPLWITGHSLGGAIALLSAWRLHQQFIPVHQICTFGAPMVGNAATAEAYHREFPKQIFRYVDASDLVPRLPTMSLFSNEYGHCQTEIVVGDNVVQKASHVLEKAAQAMNLSDADKADANAEDSDEKDENGELKSKVVEGVWRSLHAGIHSHLMGNYIAKIADQLV